jgi:cell division protein FtsA
MNPLSRGLAPRMQPLSPKRTAVVAALDIGTSKIACIIARLRPAHGRDAPRGRTHSVQIIGFGHTVARGMKAGTVVDIERVEESIRRAVDLAERSAKVEIASVVLSVSGGRIGSEAFAASVRLPGPEVESGDVARVLDAASLHSIRDGRAVLHSIPVSFGLDDVTGIRDPRGMVGATLNADLHVATADFPALRNLILAVERCHLSVEGVVAAPYAAGLAALNDDEAELGATVIDLGAGTATLAAFVNGNCVHVDGIALGGHNVTVDLARGLSTRLSEAERIKSLYGDVIEGGSDHTDLIMVPGMDEHARGRGTAVTRAQVIRIARARIDEIFDLLRERLERAGVLGLSGRNLVLTGGGAQLGGVPELASRLFGASVRIGIPRAVGGFNQAATGPAFAVAAGLAVYPQFAGREHFEPRRRLAVQDGNYLQRVGRWLKESF